MFSTIPSLIARSFPGATGGPSYDPDAQAYINAVIAAGGTLTSPQQDAVNTLYLDLKSYGLYTKIHTFYPYVGGVQNSCRIEGKLQTAYYVDFNGTWAFSSLGATPTAAWATNNQDAGATLDNTSNSFWTYLGTDVPSGYQGYFAEIGTGSYFGSEVLTIIGGNNVGGDNQTYFFNTGNNTALTFNTSIVPNGTGFFGSNRTSSSLLNAWWNGTKLGTNTGANPNTMPNKSIEFPQSDFGLNNSYRRHQFDCIAQGLTDTEATNLYTAVQAFQTALGRQV